MRYLAPMTFWKMVKNMKDNRRLGPIIGATLLTNDIERVSHAYQSILGFSCERVDVVSTQLAILWNAPTLAQNPMHILASSNGDAWLRLVEDKNSTSAQPLKTHGWMSLETNVGDVDALRKKFETNDFEVIGEPAYLQVSDAIKAMQVIGPAGEVSYLTQVERDVPPFELPMSTSETGSLFIPVLSTPSREESLKFYETLHNADKGLVFDTKVTVLNNAWGLDIENQFPVATLQLAGKCLFEIDEVPQANPIINNALSLPSGIALVTCYTKHIDTIAQMFGKPLSLIEDAYYPANKVLILKGPAGEIIELVGE